MSNYRKYVQDFKKTKGCPRKMICQICHKIFYVANWRYKRGKSKCKYCSFRCFELGQTKIHKEKAINNFSKFPNFSKEDLAYMAGIFDGEGHLTIKKNTKNSYRCQFGITNTNKNLIEFLQKKIHFSSIYSTKRRSPNMHKIYTIKIYKNVDLCKFMQLLSPYLIVKKRKYEKLLEIHPDIFSFLKKREKNPKYKYHWGKNVEFGNN